MTTDSYRIYTPDPEPPVIPLASDVTTNCEIHVLNGAIAEIAWPCYYMRCDPDTPGQYIAEPIDLVAEGYSDPYMAFSANLPGLSWDTWIDPLNHHIIRMLIVAKCPGTILPPDDIVDFSMFATRTDPDDLRERTDVVATGIVVVKPGPYELYVPPII